MNMNTDAAPKLPPSPPILFGRVHFRLKRGELLRIGAIAR